VCTNQAYSHRNCSKVTKRALTGIKPIPSPPPTRIKIEEKILGKRSPEQLKGEKRRKQEKRRYRRAKKKLASISATE
jgi:hypothetical protein